LHERAAAAFAAGRPLDEEVEYVKRDGHRFWGRLQATPVHWDSPHGEALFLQMCILRSNRRFCGTVSSRSRYADKEGASV
ncbi:hypothetical protein ACU6QH_00200, partial [Aeromonas veronii]|uniref:hypothetical protein n=1 Tax=Aeromonas veronii TaxID=654 RepID=UPI00406C4FDB